MKKRYRECYMYFREHLFRKSLQMLGTFLFSIVFAYIVVSRTCDQEKAANMIRVLRQGTSSYDGGVWHNTLLLFVNNIRASIFSVAMGMIPILFFPLLNLVFNGSLAGMVVGIASVLSPNEVWRAVLMYLLPHGVPEMIGIVLSCAMGYHLCRLITGKIFGKYKDQSVWYHFRRCGEVLVLYVAPIILVAALIEGAGLASVAL